MVMASMSRPLQDQVAAPIDPPAPAGRDDRGGVELLDDRRSGDDSADVEAVALIKSRLCGILAVEMNPALAFDRDVARSCRWWGPIRARLVFRYGHTYSHAIADHFDRSFLCGVAMNLRVALIEFFTRGDKRCRGQALREQTLQRRAQFIALAGIAQIEFTHEAGGGWIHSFGFQLFAGFFLQLPENILGVVGRDFGEWP